MLQEHTHTAEEEKPGKLKDMLLWSGNQSPLRQLRPWTRSYKAQSQSVAKSSIIKKNAFKMQNFKV